MKIDGIAYRTIWRTPDGPAVGGAPDGAVGNAVDLHGQGSNLA